MCEECRGAWDRFAAAALKARLGVLLGPYPPESWSSEIANTADDADALMAERRRRMWSDTK